MRHLTLEGSRSLEVDLPQGLYPEQLRALQRLVLLKETAIDGRYHISRRSPLRGGRVSVDDLTIIVRPDVDPLLAFRMLLFVLGANLDIAESFSAADVSGPEFDGDISRLTAVAFVRQVEDCLQRYASRSYTSRIEVGSTVRGRPLWTKLFQTPMTLAVPQEIRLLSTDTLLQRLLLASARVAAGALANSRFSFRALRIASVLEGLASEMVPTEQSFSRADQQLNTLTAQYRDALRLGRALCFGYSPNDPFLPGDAVLPDLVFDIPSLFESVVSKILEFSLRRYGLDVTLQKSDNTFVKDATGRAYLRVRPDIRVFDGEGCLSIIDCKFKPRYSGERISAADLYQILFYGETVRATSKSVPALVLIAPADKTFQLLPSGRRIIAGTGAAAREVSVLLVDLERVFENLRHGHRDNGIDFELDGLVESIATRSLSVV